MLTLSEGHELYFVPHLLVCTQHALPAVSDSTLLQRQLTLLAAYFYVVCMPANRAPHWPLILALHLPNPHPTC